MKKLLLICLALTIVVIASWPVTSQAQDGYVVIVNSANPASSVSRDLVSDFLLKKKGKWEDGTSASPADLDGQSQVRAAMSRAIHGRSVASIKNYWQRQIFSGRNVPPPELQNDAQMIAHVANSRGAIGYVSPGASLDGVKKIAIVD